ncbi:MAG TPA: serine/threonine-protein kinase [Polyangiaceae bacterium]|nr:serine/threonine-protein kinase [Polyangiaceae bacterium]
MLDETAPGLEPWKTGQLIAARYEILEHLGTGGMGVVYRVRDITNQRIRALKTIRQDLDAETKRLVSRLLKSEADALKRLESDFVVRIYETSLDEQDDWPFVIMEFLPGRDLQQLLHKQGPLPIPATVSLLWQAACALKTIHEHGIVHRDLKPANLYLKTRDDGSLELKVLDFSISRLLDRAGERKTTMVVGTRGFMAPEQAAGYDVDHRADIYSLGQVASALLQSTLEAECGGADQGPAATRLKAFNAWHAKATAYQREQRFQSAIEAIEKLAQTLGVALPNRELPKNDTAHDSLTSAATVSALPKLQWPRRALVLGIAVAAAAVAGLVLLTRGPSTTGSVTTQRAAASETTEPSFRVSPVSSTQLPPPRAPELASATASAVSSAPAAPAKPPVSRPKAAASPKPQSSASKPEQHNPDGTGDRK